MIGLFGTLDLASTSLSNQTQATAVAGQNMANVNNSAYAVERTNIQTSAPIETLAGEEGTGADIASITEVRNNMLDSQIQAENSSTGSLTAQQSALQTAEGYLGEQITNTSGTAAASTDGLAAKLAKLFNGFSGLTTEGGDPGTAVESAQEVATQFNQVSANLSQVQSGLNTSVQNEVASSNQDLAQIATLNQQIVVAEGGGQPANVLVDQREQAIENLSDLVNVSTSAQPDGSVDISIGGQAMVTGGSAVNGLQTYADPAGNLLVEDQNSSTPLTITGGSIGGNITARDGALANLQTGLDTLASQLITQVNTIYSAGYNATGGTGDNFFTGTDASDIAVNSTLAADPSQFQSSSTAGAGGDKQIALALANLATQSNPALGNQSLTQNYAQTVAGLGNAIDTTTDNLNTNQAISTSLTQQRSSASGVSIDQEMTSVLQFQKAYEAAAQLVTTVNAMLETVISMKTV